MAEMVNIISETVDNGVIENVHIAPIGEFLGSDAEGNPIPENITRESLETMASELNNSGEEILMDIDHKSTLPGNKKDTEALGWFSKFVVDPIRGLFATLKLTKKGKEVLENREYRYTSPTFGLDENGTPNYLHSVAATNLPAFKGKISPIINCECQNSEKDLTKDTITMDMTKDELIELIKETINSCAKNEAPETEEEVKEETKTEDTPVEVVEDETKVEEEVKEEVKNEETKTEEEPKEEVIKYECLNSMPSIPKTEDEPKWKSLKGNDFCNWINGGMK